MLEDQGQHVQYTYLGGLLMTNNSPIFEGYFILHNDDGIIAKSRFIDGDIHAFGPDSDYTTLAVSAANKLNITKNIGEFAMDENIDSDIMQVSGYLSNKEAEWKIICHPKSAELCITKDRYWDYQFDGYSIESDFIKSIQDAWIEEGVSVSQGAYVSDQTYTISSDARIKMTSQKIDGEIFWPPREFHHKSSEISKTPLTTAGDVESCTTLAAGGAPSEFSIRAPILGGISTVFVKLNDGPKGVFLVVDDNDDEILIGANVKLVLRKIYAQNNVVRYGLKAIIQ